MPHSSPSSGAINHGFAFLDSEGPTLRFYLKHKHHCIDLCVLAHDVNVNFIFKPALSYLPLKYNLVVGISFTKSWNVLLICQAVLCVRTHITFFHKMPFFLHLWHNIDPTYLLNRFSRCVQIPACLSRVFFLETFKFLLLLPLSILLCQRSDLNGVAKLSNHQKPVGTGFIGAVAILNIILLGDWEGFPMHAKRAVFFLHPIQSFWYIWKVSVNTSWSRY